MALLEVILVLVVVAAIFVVRTKKGRRSAA